MITNRIAALIKMASIEFDKKANPMKKILIGCVLLACLALFCAGIPAMQWLLYAVHSNKGAILTDPGYYDSEIRKYLMEIGGMGIGEG